MLLDNSRKPVDIHAQLFLLRSMVFNRTHQDGIVKKKGLIINNYPAQSRGISPDT